MQTAARRRMALYALCVSFYAIAGVLQAVDSTLPEFWHALFALLAHTILISLVVAWGVSLMHRMVRRDLRTYFLAAAVLILFFLVVRMIKYGLTRDIDVLSRYLWYGYYIPQCLIPPTLLLAAFSLENKKGRPCDSKLYLLYLPAIVLILLIFTNDIHQWAFALSFEDGGFSYSHGPVFYAALVWEIGVTFASLVVLIMKCSVSACRRKTWIPIMVFVMCSMFSAVCFLENSPAFKIPELLCFTCIAMIECSICIGIIPSNDGYEEFFHLSEYSAFITDERLDVAYRSKKAKVLDKDVLKEATETPVLLDRNTRLSAYRLHGGYVFRIDDLSKINEIDDALANANERLSEENYLIEAENELKEQRAQVAQQNRIYSMMDEATHDEVSRLEGLLSRLYRDGEADVGRFVSGMRFACVLAAYVKRRSNLVMLTERQSRMDVEELHLSIKESLDYLSLLGVECSFDFSASGEIGGKDAGVFYDFFESCIVDCDNLPEALIVHLSRTCGNHNNSYMLRMETNVTNVGAAEMSQRLESRFCGYDVVADTDGEANYYSISCNCGDGGGL